MMPFYVLTWDFNTDSMVPYDIMPYLIGKYKKSKTKVNTFSEAKSFIIDESKYQFWARCEYEIIISGWPKGKKEQKVDVYQQIAMNIDIITDIFMNNLKM